MKETWFWISKDLAELGIVAIVILIAVIYYGFIYLVNRFKRGIKRKIKYKKTKG